MTTYLDNVGPGEQFVPAYQMSATPWVTSSVITQGTSTEVHFGGFVTRFFTVKNTSNTSTVLAVGFTANGLKPANSNCFFLSGSQEYTAEMRLDRIFISGSLGNPAFTVIAGLTLVQTTRFLTVTASNGHPGVG